MEAETPNNNTALKKYTNTIQSTINNAYKKFCPLRLIQHDQTTTAWWCHELNHLRKMARKSFNEARITKLKEDWDTYKKIVRQKQRDAWRSYSKETEDFPRLQKDLSKDSHRSNQG
ncbi:unnamed protein product [Psylliodes chrysocephalus]|uniref:Uncharacterized protein n=1 Tax=Psylliodes chrysocephalus TaxID=3402493 RepID=A0A9P0CLJ1_9CUCU|nr:unnamed protein product [Psylliodes chrysocephala]